MKDEDLTGESRVSGEGGSELKMAKFGRLKQRC
jgi:hypothetical protein